MSRTRLPTPAELDETPALALLAALDHALELTLRALLAAHPQLGDPECPAWARDPAPAHPAAERLVAAASALAEAIDAYRRTVTPLPDDAAEPDPTF